MSDRLSEIEARLAAATPGPWEADVFPVRKRSRKTGRVLAYRPEDGTVGSVSVIPSDGVYGVMDGPDADLIARAPADLVTLVTFAREVGALHQPHAVICLNPSHSNDCDAMVCDTCDTPWPCPTAAALQKLGGAS